MRRPAPHARHPPRPRHHPEQDGPAPAAEAGLLGMWTIPRGFLTVAITHRGTSAPGVSDRRSPPVFRNFATAATRTAVRRLALLYDTRQHDAGGFLMQVGMVIGFFTAWPANVWLIRKGIKEAM